ncbi:MAG: hypothetical protein U5K79_16795 [Cyclobacteriaceae bacterium]|nr:hypothetical protein [Cyclobacteriaceae bacterium]
MNRKSLRQFNSLMEQYLQDRKELANAYRSVAGTDEPKDYTKS